MKVVVGSLLLSSCVMLAQRGPGGAVGGGLAGGGGLSGSTGIASGLDTKDDLKGFHEVLALQATGPQIVQYRSMLKSTESAAAELQKLQTVAKDNFPQLKDRGAALKEALEAARGANAKFLDQLSDDQKSGLKENIRRLIRLDSELAQQLHTLDAQVVSAKPPVAQISTSAQELDHTLASFHDEQLGLGEEMSITSNGTGQASFRIQPVASVLSFTNQSVTINTIGTVSQEGELAGHSTFRFELRADLSDLQRNMTDLLRAELNKSDSCGEQIAVQSAVLTPAIPASVAVTQLHYERWRCMGGGMTNEMVEGNGSIEVKLTPAIENGSLKLLPEIGRVDAGGLVGDLLRSGSLGDAVRDKVAESVLRAFNQGMDYKTILPPAAQGSILIQRAAFDGTGEGKLSAILEGDIALSNDKVSAMISELKAGGAQGQAPAPQTSQR